MKAGCLLIALITLFSVNTHAQSTVFAVDYKLNYNPFKGQFIGAYVAEDSVTNEKVIVMGGSKTYGFFLVDENWKLLKSFEAPANKSSSFKEEKFKIFRTNRNGNVWTMIVQTPENYTAETVDFSSQKHHVSGKVFADKHSDDAGQFFLSDNKSHIMYFSKNFKLRVAELGSEGSLRTITIDPLEGSNLNKASTISDKDVFRELVMIDNATIEDVDITKKFAHFYVTPENYITVIASSVPEAEVSYYDKKSGRKLKSDLFSVADLLPASERSRNRTNFVIYDNKLWLLSAYKNGGALGAFDLSTKKLVCNFKYDDKSPASIFNYGPVLTKTKYERKDEKTKSETISMDKFAKDVYISSTGLSIHPYNSNEYSVSIGFWQVDLPSRTGSVNDNSVMISNELKTEKLVAKLLFRKNEFGWIPKTEGLTESTLELKGIKIREVPKSDGKEPEFKNKKAAVISQLYLPFRHVTIYYFDGQLKVYERQTIADMTKLKTSFQ